MKFRLFCTALAIGTLIVPGRRGSAQEQFPYQIFERYLAPLAQQIGMPGRLVDRQQLPAKKFIKAGVS